MGHEVVLDIALVVGWAGRVRPSVSATTLAAHLVAVVASCHGALPVVPPVARGTTVLLRVDGPHRVTTAAAATDAPCAISIVACSLPQKHTVQDRGAGAMGRAAFADCLAAAAVLSASRRACKSPRFPNVINFSTIFCASFARVSVVVIR